MKRINLNFDWKYTKDYKDEYLSKSFDDSSFESVNIPHTNIEIPYNNFDEGMTWFVSCYRKKVYIDEALKGKSLILTFEACSSYAQVSVNGKQIGEHKGGYNMFKFDISSAVEYGKENIIVVKNDSTERPEIPPFGNVIDYLVYGGLYREAYIDVFPKAYIDEIFITPQNVLSENISVDFEFIFKNKDSSNSVNVAIIDSEGKKIATKELKLSSTSSSGEEDREKVSLDVSNIKLWDLDNPNLYFAEIAYSGAKYTKRFGFRDAIFKKKGFYLNGKLIKLRGLNRHQSYPYVGYAMPKSAQYADADFLKKELGLQIVRTSHYPNSRHFLDRCDEIGLLVFTEIPGWQHIGKEGEWWDICLRNVREMIYEGYNHPSIVLWGVRINESQDCGKLYKQTNEYARKLDKSRQTGGVRFLPRSQRFEDVYTMNDFIHSGGKMVLLPKFIASGRVPYLVTEYNGHMYPTKSFDHEKKRQEHALRHARVLNKMYQMNGLSGCIGWCMSDYNTHKDFGSGDRICYHGVSDMFRIPKLAASVYKAQQDKTPVLELTSNMEIGDVAGGQVGIIYLITNCDTVKMYKDDVQISTIDIKKVTKNGEFKHLPHPPYQLRDTIGNQIEMTGEYSKRDSNILKKVLLKAKESGVVGVILRYPISALYFMIKNRVGVQKIQDLFGEFATSWGAKERNYKFEGYMGDKCVITIGKGSVKSVNLEAKADSNTLIEDETYDVTRVVIKALSQFGNVLPYSNDALDMKTEGPIEIIGPSQVSLLGGVRGVWIKTKGKSGKAKLTINAPALNKSIELDFDVKKV